jgi:hypothetical protein
MQIELSQQAELLVQQLIDSGQASSATEAVDTMASFWLNSTLDPAPSLDKVRRLVDQARQEVSRGEDEPLDMSEIKAEVVRLSTSADG